MGEQRCHLKICNYFSYSYLIINQLQSFLQFKMLTLLGEITSRRGYVFLINAFCAKPEKLVDFRVSKALKGSVAKALTKQIAAST